MSLEVTALHVTVGLDDSPFRRGVAELPGFAQAHVGAAMRSVTDAVAATVAAQEAMLARLPAAERAARQSLVAEARQSAQQVLEAAESSFRAETEAASTAARTRVQLVREQKAVETAEFRAASSQRIIMLREEGAAARQAETTGIAAARRESAERIAAARAELAEFRTLRAQERANRQDRGSGPGIAASLAGQNLTQSVTRPIIGGLESALKETADFDTTLAVFRATSDATAGQMEKVRAKAIELGNDLTLPATSANDAAEAMGKLNQMGFSVRESMDAAKGSLQLSAAGHITNANAARYEVDTLREFGLAANQATRVADVLTNAHLRSGRSIEDVGNALKYAGPAFKQAHVPVEDAAAAIAELGRAGIFGTQAGTNLRSMIMRLEAAPPRAAAALRELNVTIYDSAGHIKNLHDIIGDLHTAMEGMNDRTKLPLLNDIFGKQAGMGGLVLVDQGVQSFDKMRAAMGRTGTAADLAKAQMAGLNGAVEGFKSAVETAELKAQPLADALAKLLNEDITPLVNKFGDLDTTTQEWILGAVAALAGAGPLLMGIGAVTSAVSLMKGAFVATEVAEGATATAGVSAFAAGGPYILALAATAAAVYKIKTAWDDANRAQDLHGRTDALDRNGTPSQAKAGDAKALRDEAADLQRQFQQRSDIQHATLWGQQLLPTDPNTALGAAYHASQDELMNRILFDLGRAKQIEDAAKGAGKDVGAAVKKNYDQGITDGLTQTPGQAVDALLGPSGGGDARGLAIEARIKAQAAAEKAQEQHHKRVEAEAKRFHEAMAAARGKLADLERGDRSPTDKLAAQFPDMSAARRGQLADIDAEITKVREARKAQDEYRKALDEVNAKIRDERNGPKTRTEQLKAEHPEWTPAQVAAIAAADAALDHLKQTHQAHAKAVAEDNRQQGDYNQKLREAQAALADARFTQASATGEASKYDIAMTAGKLAVDVFHKSLAGLNAEHRQEVMTLAGVVVATNLATKADEAAAQAKERLKSLTEQNNRRSAELTNNGGLVQQGMASVQDTGNTLADFNKGMALNANAQALRDYDKSYQDLSADMQAQVTREAELSLAQKAQELGLQDLSAEIVHYADGVANATEKADALAGMSKILTGQATALTQANQALAQSYGAVSNGLDDVYAAQRRQLNLGGSGETYTVPTPRFTNTAIPVSSQLGVDMAYNFLYPGPYGSAPGYAGVPAAAAPPATSPTVNIHLNNPNFADPRSANQRMQDIGAAVQQAYGRLGG